MNDDDAHREANRLYRLDIYKKTIQIQQQSNEYLEDYVGVFCLTQHNSKLLLWSHYSDSHKGFCVGFDSRILFEMCRAYIENNDGLFLGRVKYPLEFPLINPFEMKQSECAKTIILNKSSEWKYESEIRMILLDKSNVIITLPDDAVTCVYIGCDISDENKAKLLEIIKSRKNKVSVYQAETSHDEFKLIFKPLGLM